MAYYVAVYSSDVARAKDQLLAAVVADDRTQRILGETWMAKVFSLIQWAPHLGPADRLRAGLGLMPYLVLDGPFEIAGDVDLASRSVSAIFGL